MIATFFCAFLFAQSGWQKIAAPAYYAEVINNYRVGSFTGTVGGAISIGLFELLIAGSLLTGFQASFAAMAAAFMLLAYGAAIGLNLRRGRREIDCGCGTGRSGEGISAWHIWRNLGFVVLLAFGSAQSSAAASGGKILLAAAAASLLFVIYHAAGELISNQPRLAELRSAQ